MIICLVENCATWDGQGEMYLIDTCLLTSEPFRSLLESADSSLSLTGDDLFCVVNNQSTGWNYQYELDIQRAMVDPPQLVEKLISVTFE